MVDKAVIEVQFRVILSAIVFFPLRASIIHSKKNIHTSLYTHKHTRKKLPRFWTITAFKWIQYVSHKKTLLSTFSRRYKVYFSYKFHWISSFFGAQKMSIFFQSFFQVFYSDHFHEQSSSLFLYQWTSLGNTTHCHVTITNSPCLWDNWTEASSWSEANVRICEVVQTNGALLCCIVEVPSKRQSCTPINIRTKHICLSCGFLNYELFKGSPEFPQQYLVFGYFLLMDENSEYVKHSRKQWQTRHVVR
jgi:hypothetical protein